MKSKDLLSEEDEKLLKILSRVRGLLPETAALYRSLGQSGAEAKRKRMERLCEKGYLACSTLPSGRNFFRLSHKGAKICGAPASWATSPSAGVLAEALSVGALAWRTDEYLFPTRSELTELLTYSLGLKVNSRIIPLRFLIRTSPGAPSEPNLHLLLAEIRPADELHKRTQTILQNVTPTFLPLVQANLFGVTIAVPAEGVKHTLVTKQFPLGVNIVVIDELKQLLAL